MTKSQHKNLILAHHYLYYVLGTPKISDYQYDILEKEYKEKFGDDLGVGSDSASSYSKKIIKLARNIQ